MNMNKYIINIIKFTIIIRLLIVPILGIVSNYLYLIKFPWLKLILLHENLNNVQLQDLEYCIMF